MPKKFTIKKGDKEFGVLLDKPAGTLKGRKDQALKAHKRGKSVLLNAPGGAVKKMKGANLSASERKKRSVSTHKPRKRGKR